MAIRTTTPDEEAAPAEPLAADLGWLLAKASHALATEQTAALERIGISPRSYCLLTTAMTGSYTQIELAQKVGLDKTTMVVTLDELEAAGLAERRPSPEDRRARVVAVTAAGRDKAVQAREVVEAIQADVLGALPAPEGGILLDALRRLVGDRLSRPAPCSQPVRRRAPR